MKIFLANLIIFVFVLYHNGALFSQENSNLNFDKESESFKKVRNTYKKLLKYQYFINKEYSMVSSDELIKKMQELNSPIIGLDGNRNSGGFYPVDGDAIFNGGLLPVTPQKSFEPLRELISRGLEPLPLLLSNLDNKSKTGLKIKILQQTPGGNLIYGGYIVTNSYTFRNKENLNKMTNLINSTNDKLFNENIDLSKDSDGDPVYIPTVGDVCYLAIGQIVNKNYIPIEWRGGFVKIINSPTNSPGIAEAVRLDWKNLTQDEHKKILINDCLKSNTNEGIESALKRLILYYPDYSKSNFD